MAENTLKRIYETHVVPLAARDRLRMLEMIAQGLADESPELESRMKARATGVFGRGAQSISGAEGPSYLNELRNL